MSSNATQSFLPMYPEEMHARGWRELDILLITGDAYVDHPSFGAAVIGRVLEQAGYRVGIVARPNWRSTDDFKRLGRPTLFAGVTAGAVDSIVNNFTAHMARRRQDVFAPGGQGGGRPDMATLVYANRVRETFPNLPVVLGGIEASLRRFAYFDAVKSKIRRSILVDSRADILVWGPGEQPALTIAHRLASGDPLSDIPGTARFIAGQSTLPKADVYLPHFTELTQNPDALWKQTTAIERSARPGFQGRLVQSYPEGFVIAEPGVIETAADLDATAALPFVRAAHPSYSDTVPALETVRWSVISHRGCPGGCSFCGLAAHQGRAVISRSSDAIIDEIKNLTRMPGFKGTITDVGGPTANAFGLVRATPDACQKCKRVSCLYPKICKHLIIDPSDLLDLLDNVSVLPNVRHLFLASGIRHDMALHSTAFIKEVAARYTGGHLKVAPEHVDPEVLRLMRKPGIALFERFEKIFLEASKKAGKEQYIVPYIMVGFPGCGRAQSDRVSHWLTERRQSLEQAQAFMPLAGTAAATMVATQKESRGDHLFIPDLKEKRRQKSMVTTPVSKGRPKKGRPNRKR